MVCFLFKNKSEHKQSDLNHSYSLDLCETEVRLLPQVN